MVDMVKKIHKKSADLLEPGEELSGACVIMGVGQFKKNVAFGAVGGLVGAAVGQAISGKADEVAAGSMADGFPNTKQAILALSNQRWVVFEQSAMSGAAKSVAASWALEDITSLTAEKGRLTYRIAITFADGSVAQVESVKRAKPGALADAAAKRR